MIVQACLNGARSSDFHPALPITADAMAAMVRPALLPVPPSCICPRAPDGHESLAPATMDVTVLAVRKACPGTLIGVSTAGLCSSLCLSGLEVGAGIPAGENV